MSQYTNYEDTSRGYGNDTGRQAVASDVLVGLVQVYAGKAIQNVRGLDAGCGTGNYAKAFTDRGVGELTLIDASDGMMRKAQDKMADAYKRGQVKEIKKCILPDLPFQDEQFDFVMFNQVLHHLETKADGQHFPGTEKALLEAFRVLKRPGVLLITACLPSQTSKGLWYYNLLPEASRKCTEKYPSYKQYRDMFQRIGFKCREIMSVLGSDFFSDYHNVEGPFEKIWRDNDSYWSLATEEELAVGLKKLENLKEIGQLQQWKEDHDHVDTIGSISVICAQKL